MFARKKCIIILGVVANIFLTGLTHTTDFFVSSDDDIRDLVDAGSVQPGDTVIWRNGTYSDQSINFNFMGTEADRITLRAETPGGVMFRGESFIKFGGDYLTVSGFHFNNADNYLQEVASSIVQFRANNGNRHAHHCRLTNTVISDMNSHEQDVDDDDDDGDTEEFIFHSSKWVQVYGTKNRVDHCHFDLKRVRGALIVFELVPQDGEGGTPYPEYNHRVDHNTFGPNPVGFVSNEFETIRTGTSTYSNFNCNSVVEHNYFYRCDGEIEIISNKSTNNTIRNNTFVECQGSVVMRHGDGAVVAGNIILANGVANSGGIRLSGQDHIVRNNYVSGTRGSGLRGGLVLRRAGGVTGEDTSGGYEQVRFCEIVHNTFVDNRQTFNLAESGSRDNSFFPTDNVIANNILLSSQGTLIENTSGLGAMTYAGNIAFGSTLGFSDAGFTEVDPLLSLASDNLFRAGAGSPVLEAADSTYSVIGDIDGDTRAMPADIGADEVTTTTMTLAPRDFNDDVGPDWLNRGPRPSSFFLY
jgi:poly(beta-D-mannuronate) lyase